MKPNKIFKEAIVDLISRVYSVFNSYTKFQDDRGEEKRHFEHYCFTSKLYRDAGSACFKTIIAFEKLITKSDELYIRFYPEVVSIIDFDKDYTVYKGRFRASVYRTHTTGSNKKEKANAKMG